MEYPPRPVQELAIPHVWRGRELARVQERTLPTGHALLDAQLPGGGWPVASLVEVLQAQPHQHVWQLVGPVLAGCTRQEPGPVVLVNPPCEPFGPALQGLGLQGDQLLRVQAPKVSTRLWATEQALRCAEVTAVLAWLPQSRNEDLRRLQLAAHQFDKLLFVFRGLECRNHASPARLRLLLEGVETMEVRILKRRGPPLLQPLLLPAQPRKLAALLAARKARRLVQPVPAGSHVLDRTASYAE